MTTEIALPLLAVGGLVTTPLTSSVQPIRIVVDNPNVGGEYSFTLTSEDADWFYDSSVGMAKPITVKKDGSISFRTGAREFLLYAKTASAADLHILRTA